MFPRIVAALGILLFCSISVRAADDQCVIRDITWTLGANLPEFRKGGCLTVLGGNVLSVFGMRYPWGEMATLYVYDPVKDDWTRGPDGPIGQVYVEGTECNGAFYAVGGRRGGLQGSHGKCFRLSEKSGQCAWDDLPSLNQARGWAPSASVGTRLYVFGGATVTDGITLGSVETLDTAKPNDQWQKIADIPGAPRGWLGATAVNGKIYLIGGLHTVKSTDDKEGLIRRRLNEVWQFDPATERWEPRHPLPYRLSGFDSCAYANRYIIVCGGAAVADDFTSEMQKISQADRAHESYYCPFVLVYDTVKDQWQRLPSLLPMPTNDIRVVLAGDKLYALGGENIEPATSNTTPWLRIGTIVQSSPQ